MRLIRSWPRRIPKNRAYVQDGMERLVMDSHDYRVLAPVDDDVLLLEWDIAVGQQELDRFIGYCQAEPERVQVAPYQIHQSLSGNVYPCHPLWAHRRYVGTPESGTVRIITRDDPTCHLFGFGAVYLPRRLVTRFLDWYPTGHFDDVIFASWHYIYAGAPEVPIHWDVPVVHLHYRLPITEREPSWMMQNAAS